MSTIRYNIEKAIINRVSVLTRDLMVTVEGNDFKVAYNGVVVAEKVGSTLRVFTDNPTKGVKTRINIVLELYGLPLLFQMDFKWYFEDSVLAGLHREFTVADEYYNVYDNHGDAFELINATSIDEINEWVKFRLGDTTSYKDVKEIEEKYNFIINKTNLPI